MATVVREERVQAVRQFSRFYTKRIGVLQERLLGGVGQEDARLLLCNGPGSFGLPVVGV